MILNTLLRALGDDFHPEDGIKYDAKIPVAENEVVVGTLKGHALNALVCALEASRYADEKAALALEAEAQALRTQDQDDWSRFDQKRDVYSVALNRFRVIRSVLFQELLEEYNLTPGHAYGFRHGFKLVKFRSPQAAADEIWVEFV